MKCYKLGSSTENYVLLHYITLNLIKSLEILIVRKISSLKRTTFFSGTGQLVMYGTDTSSDVAVSATPSSDVNVTTQHETNVTLYIVFGVVSLVFVVVIIVVVKIMRRKNANPNGYTLTSTGKKTNFSLLIFFCQLRFGTIMHI
jgi:hypothetical protein